jgi:hypothetical protein
MDLAICPEFASHPLNLAFRKAGGVIAFSIHNRIM